MSKGQSAGVFSDPVSTYSFSSKSPFAPHPHTIDPFDHGYLKLLLAGPRMICFLILGILLAVVLLGSDVQGSQGKRPYGVNKQIYDEFQANVTQGRAA